MHTPPARAWRIKELPETDRPREKLIQSGSEQLTDAELLAVILGTGSSRLGLSALDLARHLLTRFDSLRGLGSAGVGELTELPGIGPVRAVQVKAAMELARRLGQSGGSAILRFRSSEDIFLEYHSRMRDLRQERFMVVLLDARNRRLKDVVISQGSLTETVVHPREVFVPVVRESAAGMLLIHNHPSGDPTPSSADLELTRRLQVAAEIFGVFVLDHVIIGRDAYVSFVDEGWLPAGGTRQKRVSAS